MAPALGRYWYDPVAKTLTMTNPLDRHEALINAYHKAVEQVVAETVNPDRKLLQALRMTQGHGTAGRKLRNILHKSKYPDSLYVLQSGKHNFKLGPMEVGSSQPLHGVKGVLLTVRTCLFFDCL